MKGERICPDGVKFPLPEWVAEQIQPHDEVNGLEGAKDRQGHALRPARSAYCQFEETGVQAAVPQGGECVIEGLEHQILGVQGQVEMQRGSQEESVVGQGEQPGSAAPAGPLVLMGAEILDPDHRVGL